MLLTVKMFRALMSGELTGMWTQVTNPAQSMPNLHETMENGKDRFLVVFDVYPTAPSRIAQVVLSSALWVEKNGVFGNTERRTQQWFKMVDPPGQARDDVWQMLAVAHRMYEQGNEIEAWKWDVFKETNVDQPLFNEYRKLTL